jgi:hypothetical protein
MGHHVLVNIYETAAQIFAGFYGCCMVAMFPESPFAALALDIFLAGATCPCHVPPHSQCEKSGEKDYSPVF